jgi:2-dehydro-3-deoxygluconokinase
VLYDRAGSAASQLRPGVFDWPAILSSASALHCTGITCALGPEAEQTVLEATRCAAELGVLTSFDVNYRGQLWSPDQAAAALARVLPGVDLLFASPFDFQLLTGSEVSADSAADLRRRFGLSQVIVRSQEEVSSGVLEVTVRAFSDDRAPASGTAQATVLDAFGAGDAAVAGFLARYLASTSVAEAVSAAAEASAYMYTIPGDTWLQPPAGFTPEHGKLGRVRR